MLNKKCYEMLYYLRHFTLILLMCVVYVANANVAFAETIQPDDKSDNIVTIDNDGYTINGKRYEFKNDGSIRFISGGGSLLDSAGGSASNNTVNVNALTESASIFGGYANNGEASNNKINVNDSNLTQGQICGGYGKIANANEVNITNSNIYSVVGGSGYEESKNNSVVLNGGIVYGIRSGTASENGVVQSNNVTINNGKVGFIQGGISTGGDAIGNVIDINGGEVTNTYNEFFDADSRDTALIYAGSTNNGNATDNIINVNDGTIEGFAYAGLAVNGNATGNVININGGNVKGKPSYSSINDKTYMIAGLATNGNADNNIININGGTVGGLICAGSANNSVTDNAINIRNKPILNDSELYGYFDSGTANDVTHSGNALNIYTKNLSAKSVQNFDLINFYLGSAKAENGDTMLTVDTANLNDTKIYGIVDGDTSLKEGDKVTLLNATNLATNDGTTYEGQIAQGVSFLHPVTVTKNDNSIVATVGAPSSGGGGNSGGGGSSSGGETSGGGNSGGGSSGGGETSGGGNSGGGSSGGLTPTLLEQTNIIPSAPSIAPRSIISHIDSTINWLPPDSFTSVGTSSAGNDTSVSDNSSVENSGDNESGSENAEAEKKELGNDKHAENSGFEAFGNIGTSVMTTDTGNGSHVKSRTSGIDVGLARVFDNGHGGKTHVAPIFDYGGGTYDSYLADGTHGKGNTHFFLGGIIARKTEENGFYYEGSFRMGRSTVDFKSDDLLQGETPTRVAYNSSARVWAAHVHIGRKLFLSPNDSLNMYGIYYHTHQGSMDAKLSTGENYIFDAVTNRRLRVGARLTRHANPHSVFYSGLAYQWESASAANATCDGARTNNSGVSGSSFMLELGWQYKPVVSSPWTIDVGAVGWAGHQRGVSAQIKAKLAF